MIVRAYVALLLGAGSTFATTAFAPAAFAQTADGGRSVGEATVEEATVDEASVSSSAARPAEPQRYLGVRTTALPDAVRAQIRELVPLHTGLLVTQVVPRSPAERGGVETFDVLVGAGRTPLAEPRDLDAALAGVAAGETLTFRLVRGGRATTLDVAVESRPAEDSAATLAGADLARAALPYSQARASGSAAPREGVPLAVGPIGERSILVTSRDGTSFAVVVEEGEERWAWRAEGAEAKPPAALPERHVANVARLLKSAGPERKRGALHFRVQPRADGAARSVVLLLQQLGAEGEYRLLEIERTLTDGDTLPVDRLLEIASLQAEFEQLGPAVREKLESALRRYRVPPVQARVRQPQ